MSLLKSSYQLLPVWAQNVAVRLFSVKNARLKYGKIFHERMTRLAQHEALPLPQLLDIQERTLHRMLSYARQHVPYYRTLHCPPDDLSAWPILEKETVKSNPRLFLSDEFHPTDLISLRTSGTTGSPLEVKVSRQYHQMEMAFRWRHKAWAGVPYLSRGAYLSGHAVVPSDQVRPPFWRNDPVEKRLLCSSYHLTAGNLPYYVEALVNYQPDFIHGYPSSLFLLSQFMLRQGLGNLRPKAVFTASESLLDYQRFCIESALGARVFNWYGNTEMTCNIIQCREGSLHYRTDYGILEVLEDGSMVCTGLNNHAMPFIRYRIGDRVSMGDGTCACGCQFPVIAGIEGRSEDYIVTPDGRFVGRLDHLLKDVQHVREAQIVQSSIEEVIIRIVRAEEYSLQEEQTILSEARSRLGHTIRIHFDYVASIPREPGGKFRFIKSRLAAPVHLSNSPGSFIEVASDESPRLRRFVEEIERLPRDMEKEDTRSG